ncbi:MAG: hypothetical protein M1832_003686 [Thelocarpon impressellum]|nr:MAG: hypothetical protein M1832_003686 [Thelocarpon impressellum]
MFQEETPSCRGRSNGNGGSNKEAFPAAVASSMRLELEAPDAGLRSLDHYKNRLPRWRYVLRQKLIPLVRWETPYVAWLQDAMRTPALDSYFAITANLGTHTFFMIMLPILFWCGHTALGRGMVHVLAGGVFFSGWIKDLLCLPRPLSPPLQRITMSGSAALEYGFPSTHSTNAVSVVVYLLFMLRSPSSTSSPHTRLVLELLCFCYATSILLGRLYCGMHGFLDVIIGGVLGAMLSVLQCLYGEALDRYLYASGTYHGALLIFMVICVLVRTHPEPADDCPCFDDSVAFAGVTIGCEVGNWHYANSGWAWDEPVPATVPFRLEHTSYLKVVGRIVFGVLTIFLWREVMKPSLLRGLPPLFRVIERLGLNLPRRFFVQASEYKKVPAHIKDDNVIPSVSELPSLFTAMRHPRKRAVSIGPQSAADAYETLAYREKRRRESTCSAGAIGEGIEPQSDQRGHFSMPSSPTDGSSATMGLSTMMSRPALSRILPIQPLTAVQSYEHMMGQGSVSALESCPASPASETATLAQQQEDVERKHDEREDREMFSRLERQRVRYDVEVVTKLIVYAGIALLAVEVNPILFELVGLGMGGQAR